MTSTTARALAAVLLAAAAACDAGAMRPTGAADPGEGRLIAMGGGPHGAESACFTCHGLAGEGDGATTPRLAGLGAGYLERQLHDYALDRRPDPVMSGIAKGLTVEQRRAAARYYAALAPAFPAPPAIDPREAALGARIYGAGAPERGLAACRDCHGEPLSGMGPGVPALGGQPKAYTVEQLHRWRLGRRRNDPRGTMVAVAQAMREDEVEAVAVYLSSVRP